MSKKATERVNMTMPNSNRTQNNQSSQNKVIQVNNVQAQLKELLSYFLFYGMILSIEMLWLSTHIHCSRQHFLPSYSLTELIGDLLLDMPYEAFWKQHQFCLVCLIKNKQPLSTNGC